MENKVTNPRYYTLEEVCDLYSLNKLDLLKFMRNNKILHSERFIFVQERKKNKISRHNQRSNSEWFTMLYA